MNSLTALRMGSTFAERTAESNTCGGQTVRWRQMVLNNFSHHLLNRRRVRPPECETRRHTIRWRLEDAAENFGAVFIPAVRTHKPAVSCANDMTINDFPQTKMEELDMCPEPTAVHLQQDNIELFVGEESRGAGTLYVTERCVLQAFLTPQ